MLAIVIMRTLIPDIRADNEFHVKPLITINADVMNPQ